MLWYFARHPIVTTLLSDPRLQLTYPLLQLSDPLLPLTYPLTSKLTDPGMSRYRTKNGDLNSPFL